MQGVLNMIRTSYFETWEAWASTAFHRQDLSATLDWILRQAKQTPVYAIQELYANTLSFDLREKLEGVKEPVALLHGRHDQIVDPRWIEYSAQKLPDCKVVWFENSGHFPMLEEHDKCSQTLAEFAKS